MGSTARTRARPRLLHIAFLALVVTSLWVLFAQDKVMTLRFRPQPVQKHLFYGPPRANQDAFSFSRDVDTLLRMGDRVLREEHGEIFPEEIFAVDWSQFVSRRDVLHVGAIQRACTKHTDSAISYTFGQDSTSDPLTDGSLINRTMEAQALLETLRECPSVDIYIPNGLRGQGYCEDAAVYTKYLQARLIPRWVLDIKLFDKTLNREVSYHELCPYTPIVFFNAYWDGVRDDPKWPTTKPLYLMPNIEMTALDVTHYRQADVILCKTAICAQYLTMWFEQEGNPRMTKVVYHRFTSSDVATNALANAGLESADAQWQERPKDFQNVQFIHTAGTSTEKGSRFVLNCWLKRPDLPVLDFYMSEELYDEYYKNRYGERIRASKNVQLHVGKVDAISFGQMIARTAFFLCTSYMEGYGHYINHARASGGLIVTPDVPPMNELVSRSSGVLHRARRGAIKAQFLGGIPEHPRGLRNVPGFAAFFDGPEICEAVDEIVTNLNATERHRRARRARQQFFYDTAFFAMKMRELRAVLQPESDGN